MVNDECSTIRFILYAFVFIIIVGLLAWFLIFCITRANKKARAFKGSFNPNARGEGYTPNLYYNPHNKGQVQAGPQYNPNNFNRGNQQMMMMNQRNKMMNNQAGMRPQQGYVNPNMINQRNIMMNNQNNLMGRNLQIQNQDNKNKQDFEAYKQRILMEQQQKNQQKKNVAILNNY